MPQQRFFGLTEDILSDLTDLKMLLERTSIKHRSLAVSMTAQSSRLPLLDLATLVSSLQRHSFARVTEF